jgi:hypothetical protein
MIRLLHKNEKEKLNIVYNADMIANALQIPSASVRRTLYNDYPECFIRNRVTGIMTSSKWPDGIPFDPEPREDTNREKPLNSKYLVDRLSLFLTETQTSQLASWIDGKKDGSPVVPLSLRKDTPQEWWDLYNAAKTTLILLKTIRSKTPSATFNRQVSDTDNTSAHYTRIVEKLEQYIKSAKS